MAKLYGREYTVNRLRGEVIRLNKLAEDLC